MDGNFEKFSFDTLNEYLKERIRNQEFQEKNTINLDSSYESENCKKVESNDSKELTNDDN